MYATLTVLCRYGFRRKKLIERRVKNEKKKKLSREEVKTHTVAISKVRKKKLTILQLSKMNIHINTTETPIACRKCFISADGSSSSANTERKPQFFFFSCSTEFT